MHTHECLVLAAEWQPPHAPPATSSMAGNMMNKASSSRLLLLLLGLLAALAMATTTAASRVLSQEIAEKGGSGELTLEEAKTVAAYVTAFENWPPSKNDAKKAVKVVEVDADGNELEDVTSAMAAAKGKPFEKFFRGTWTYGLVTVDVNFGMVSHTGTVKASVRIPVIGIIKTLGPYNITPAAPCVTMGYVGIFLVKVCVSVALRKVVLTGLVLGKMVLVTLISWV